MVFCFRVDHSPPAKDLVLQALADLHKTPAGQQVLTVFQFDTVRPSVVDSLKPGLELLDEYDRITASAATAGSQSGAANVRPPVQKQEGAT